MNGMMTKNGVFQRISYNSTTFVENIDEDNALYYRLAIRIIDGNMEVAFRLSGTVNRPFTEFWRSEYAVWQTMDNTDSIIWLG